MRDLIAAGLFVGVSLSWLLVFAFLWFRDSVKVLEPNVILRSLETAGLFFIFVFAVYHAFKVLRRIVNG